MDEKLKSYLDNGYLSREKRYEFLKDEGILYLVGTYKEPVIRGDKTHEYMKLNNEIDLALKRLQRKTAGNMGTNKYDNDINPDDIDL